MFTPNLQIYASQSERRNLSTEVPTSSALSTDRSNCVPIITHGNAWQLRMHSGERTSSAVWQSRVGFLSDATHHRPIFALAAIQPKRLS